jgi:hypothetical protein
LQALGLFLWKRRAAQLAAGIAVFAAFGIDVALGGAFEVRTAGAMTLCSIVWIAIAVSACRAPECFAATQRGDVYELGLNSVPQRSSWNTSCLCPMVPQLWTSTHCSGILCI